MSGADKKRAQWERERRRMIHPVDDDIAKLADEIYEDMKVQLVARKRGERQKGALVGLGYKGWMGPWGGWTEPDTKRARDRILASLEHKPYYARLKQIGLWNHPQRFVPLRAEWLKPYCRLDAQSGSIRWGLEETRERGEVFAAMYDVVELLVIDNGEVIAKEVSAGFDNGNSLVELNLDDDDYRFQVGSRNHDWGYAGKWFDFALIDGEWVELDPQGRGWNGEWEGSALTQSETGALEDPGSPDAAMSRARAYFEKQRIEKENKLYGGHAKKYAPEQVAEYLSNALNAEDARAIDFWSAVKRIQDERGAGDAPANPKAPPALVAKVREYAAETHEGIVHVNRWKRVLAACGEDNGQSPMTAQEAKRYADRGWGRWVPVVVMLEQLESG